MKYSKFMELFEGSEYLSEVIRLRTESNSLLPDNFSQTEIHHIYLQSFEDGRINTPENLIKVTVAEHFYLHLLLVRSFEQLEHTTSISYEKAVAALSSMFQVRWKNLTEAEKSTLEQQIPELSLQKERASAMSHKLLHEVLREKYGDVMVGCHTDEAKAKSKQTREKKYGSSTACANTPEAICRRIESSKRTHIERYGSMTACMNTPEAREKAALARLGRTGTPGGAFMFEDVRKKAKETIIAKYGGMTACMDTPEARKKAQETIEQRFGKRGGQFQTEEAKAKRCKVEFERRHRRMSIIRSEEFMQWFEPIRGEYDKRTQAVNRFLTETGRVLEDYPIY